MEKFFAYIRVSTAKQGEKGVPLQEQKDAITRYTQRYSLEISQRFEERETAAKRGRPVFTQMLRLLRQKRARGVIIHKIDRSARNLKDWADLGEMIDAGVEVHFANESLDLHTRGGRLSADIQAVVAADYIRNKREETRKGFYGRLKQGWARRNPKCLTQKEPLPAYDQLASGLDLSAEAIRARICGCHTQFARERFVIFSTQKPENRRRLALRRPPTPTVPPFFGSPGGSPQGDRRGSRSWFSLFAHRHLHVISHPFSSQFGVQENPSAREGEHPRPPA